MKIPPLYEKKFVNQHHMIARSISVKFKVYY